MKKLIFLISILPTFAWAKNFQTNALNVKNAPNWVKRTKVEKATDRVQTKLEWSTRRINLFWHTTNESFVASHKLGSQALAVTTIRNGVVTVHMGPKVNQGKL